MRNLPTTLAAHLASGVTTLATCWRLTRRDGVVMGFTDHDRDLVFDATEFLARTGFEAAEVASELGLAVAGGEVAGALSADTLSEAALEAGLYDAAQVETYLVNWTDPAERHLVSVGSIGEVRRQDGAFAAELRSAAHRLNEVQGRLYARGCDAEVGDARCQVNLGAVGLSESGLVASTDGRLFVIATGIAAPPGRFDAGRLTWTSGANAGRTVEIKEHRASPAGAHLDLWRPTSEPIAPGDGLTITAGCDKTFRTCRDVFANARNFRGFPHIPGNDRVLGYARPGDANNGLGIYHGD
jgi:uncharacterized phage protein (TIGR02218 family)